MYPVPFADRPARRGENDATHDLEEVQRADGDAKAAAVGGILTGEHGGLREEAKPVPDIREQHDPFHDGR